MSVITVPRWLGGRPSDSVDETLEVTVRQDYSAVPDDRKSPGRKVKKPNPYLDGSREWNAQFGRQVS